jgi:dephospho-CoA kinase
MLLIGLTGSIGMGKSETAKLFAAHGWPCFDADAAVHQLYATGGAAVLPIAARFPEAVVDGVVDRQRLSGLVLGKAPALADLEAIVHPLVRQEQDAAAKTAREAGADAIVLDIPLLFEKGRTGEVDIVVVVSAPEDVQRERVMARPGMTAEKFAAILHSQMPDAEKRRRADFVVDTGSGREAAAAQVAQIVNAIRQRYGTLHDSRNRTRH